MLPKGDSKVPPMVAISPQAILRSARRKRVALTTMTEEINITNGHQIPNKISPLLQLLSIPSMVLENDLTTPSPSAPLAQLKPRRTGSQEVDPSFQTGSKSHHKQHDIDCSADGSVSSPSLKTARTKNENRPRSMKKCTVPFCASLARSRGLCKAHGGGKRCKRPGCNLSDQGGGSCIRHGGGKRCQVDGCEKSAQSRRFCKAHGGGIRCRIDGCEKSSQGGGLCRMHGGGPRRSKIIIPIGGDEEGGTTQASESSSQSSQSRLSQLLNNGEVVEYLETTPKANIKTQHHRSLTSHKPSPPMSVERVECEKGTSALAFKIRRSIPTTPHDIGWGDTCRVMGCMNRSTHEQLCEEHSTHLFVAASLLNMQTQ